ncbi:hypothetical protein P3X46_018636 [Hevea brasiliensis]|uniref:Gnk2-homologous domain-containing protein n=1 Tax=Hevea brasiliensis TaxID=3981 RepID=A0ABQ9LSN7_HEVBR|nr:cysteine-rich repeat secretory protein 38-like [Hevea brasiliensis]KAJ9170535.1 hypothetical protein P3X46_018636 [Hevea brasiliensis]
MSFSRISFFFILLSLAVIFQMVLGTNPLMHYCSSNDNFTSHGPYERSLTKLMGNFYYLAPPNGFALGSLGQNSQERPYGLTLCRGDVSASDCRTCVAEARSEIRKLCPNKKEGIIWYDNCVLKYSNKDFFGQIDKQNKFYLLNVQNVNDPMTFNQKTKELLSQLARIASTTPRMYAAGDLELDDQGSKKVYGLAQCTRDLSSVDCNKCLDGAIDELPSCCDGKQGGRVVGGSCTIMYEIYPFVNA